MCPCVTRIAVTSRPSSAIAAKIRDESPPGSMTIVGRLHRSWLSNGTSPSTVELESQSSPHVPVAAGASPVSDFRRAVLPHRNEQPQHVDMSTQLHESGPTGMTRTRTEEALSRANTWPMAPMDPHLAAHSSPQALLFPWPVVGGGERAHVRHMLAQRQLHDASHAG